MNKQDHHRLAVITGTSQGLGYHLAQILLSDGWQVIGLARHTPPLQNPGYEHHHCDLSDITRFQSQSVPFLRERLATQAPEHLALINNAGVVGPIVGSKRLSLAEMERSLRINWLVPAWLMGFFWENARGRSYRIVNVSSGAARAPYAAWLSYCSSKAALQMASEVLAQEIHEAQQKSEPGPADMHIINYNPGPLDTPMQADVRASKDPAFSQHERFLRLSQEDGLGSPAIAAREIVAWLRCPTLNKLLIEARYGNPIPS